MKKITKKFMNEELKAEVKELITGEHKDAVLAYGSECAIRGVQVGLTAAAVCMTINKLAKYCIKRMNVRDGVVAANIAKKVAK